MSAPVLTTTYLSADVNCVDNGVDTGIQRNEAWHVTFHIMYGFSTAQGKIAAAQEALDQALGLDFGIRESAAYATIKAQLLLAEGQPADAERLLQAAMNMPGVKRAVSAATM